MLKGLLKVPTRTDLPSIFESLMCEKLAKGTNLHLEIRKVAIHAPEISCVEMLEKRCFIES